MQWSHHSHSYTYTATYTKPIRQLHVINWCYQIPAEV
jgi:hypothetical protein